MNTCIVNTVKLFLPCKTVINRIMNYKPNKKKECGNDGKKEERNKQTRWRRQANGFCHVFTNLVHLQQNGTLVLRQSLLSTGYEKNDGTSVKDENISQEEDLVDEDKSLREPNLDQLSELMVRKEHGSVIADHEIISNAIEKHDIGLLTFNGMGKAIIPDALRTKTTRFCSKYFQSNEGPFLPTKNRSINAFWLVRKVGYGQGEDIPRTWPVDVRFLVNHTPI